MWNPIHRRSNKPNNSRNIMIYTIVIKYTDGTSDVKECHDISEIPLDNVEQIRVVRQEDEDGNPIDKRKTK